MPTFFCWNKYNRISEWTFIFVLFHISQWKLVNEKNEYYGNNIFHKKTEMRAFQSQPVFFGKLVDPNMRLDIFTKVADKWLTKRINLECYTNSSYTLPYLITIIHSQQIYCDWHGCRLTNCWQIADKMNINEYPLRKSRVPIARLTVGWHKC